jgi:hypothetical protein
MSHATTAPQKVAKKSTAERFLSACSPGKISSTIQGMVPGRGDKKGASPIDQGVSAPFKPAVNPSQVSKTEKVATKNLVPQFNNLGLERIVLTGKLVFEVTIELTGEAYETSEKNDLIMKDLKTVAINNLGKLVDEQIKNTEAVLKSCDKSDIPVEHIQLALLKNCEATSAILSVKMQQLIVAYIESNKAIKAAYRRYQIGCVSSIVTSISVVVVSIVVTGVTWGATAPVAVVGIVRSCIQIGVKVYQMAIDAQQVIDQIHLYFKALDAVLEEINAADKDASSTKFKNSAKDAGLGVLAGLTGLPFPTVEQIKDDAGLLESKLQGIHTNRLAMGEEMAKSRKEISEYKKKLVELRSKPDHDKKKIAKYEEAIKVCEASIGKFDKQTDEMYADVRRYIDEQKIITKKLDVYKSIVGKWNRHASQVTGFVVGLALDLGSTGGGLETGLAAVASLMGTLKDYADEKFYG